MKLSRLTRLVDLRPGEEYFFIPMTLFMMLGGVGASLGGSAAESLFIRTAGVSSLPSFFVLSDLSITLGSLGLGLVGGRVDAIRILSTLEIAGPVGLLGLIPVLSAGGRLGAYALFILFQFTLIMGSIQLGALLRSRLDLGQLKRVVPALYAASSLGRIAGGLATPLLVGAGGTSLLLASWAALQVVRAWVLRVVARTSTALPDAPLRPRPVSTWRQDLLRDPLSLWCLGFTFILFVTCRLLDFQSSRIFAAQFPTPETLSSFYGTFAAGGSLVAVALGALVTPWLLARHGLARTLAVFPAAALLTGLALAASGSTTAAVLARGDVQVVRWAVLQPAQEVLQGALPLALAGQVNLLASGAVIPAASLSVGLLLTLAGAGVTDLELGLTIALAGLTLLALVPRLSSTYGAVLVRILDERQLGRLRAMDLPVHDLDSRALESLSRQAVGSDPEPAAMATQLLAQSRDPRTGALLRQVVTETSSEVVARRALAHPQVLPGGAATSAAVEMMCKRAARDEAAVGPLRAVADHLASRAHPSDGPLLERLADHADPAVSAGGVAGLHALGRLPPHRASQWRAALDPAGPEGPRKAACILLARVGDRDSVAGLHGCLVRGVNVREVLECLGVLDQTPSLERFVTYRALLSSRDGRVRDLAATLVERVVGEERDELLVDLLGHWQPSLVDRARRILARHPATASPRLDRAFADPARPASLRQEALDLWALWQDRPRLAGAADHALRQALMARSDRDHVQTLGPQDDRNVLYLAGVLAQRSTHWLGLACRGYLLLDRVRDAGGVLAGLTVPDPGVRARAFEAVARVLPGPLGPIVIPALDSSEDPRPLERARALGLVQSGDPDPLTRRARGGDPYLAAGALVLMKVLGRAQPDATSIPCRSHSLLEGLLTPP